MKKGYEKVKACCELAASEGYKYAWIDTCCIGTASTHILSLINPLIFDRSLSDKSSSAELSEALNSMFAWYRRSAVCYVYLDTDISGETLTTQDLRRGRWIYRGWTLQELIAPNRVSIYTKHWKFCGSRCDLAPELHEATHISPEVLSRQDGIALDLAHFSIAMRMSWASMRKTTRPEDIAYCLLGMFDVHLPLLYGEGARKAFMRLQEQIIKNTMDLSFLAWDRPYINNSIDGRRCYAIDSSAMAKSPACFSSNRPIVKVNWSVEPFRMTNLGLHVNLPLIANPHAGEYIVVLPNCRFQYDHQGPLGLRLVPSLVFSGTREMKIYSRFEAANAELMLLTVPEDMLRQARNETFYFAI